MTEYTPVDKKKMELLHLKRAFNKQLNLCFDASHPESRPTPLQLDIMKDYEHRIFWILGSNRSGKSQTGSRVVSWWFNNSHPYIARPKEWGDGPLQIMIMGRVKELVESELWENKIKPLCIPGTYKEVRVGNSLQRIENTENGNRIIIGSHNHPDEAREKAQGFTPNIVWLDEMPGAASIVSELLVRVITGSGFLYATFTPLDKNPEIRKIADSNNPLYRRETLKVLDNPALKGKEAEVEAAFRALSTSEAEFRARMYGEWYKGDSRVFSFDSVSNIVSQPPEYNWGWRHIAVVDPSASGLTGLTLWAEHPLTGIWYCTLAEYVNGSAAFELVAEVEKRIAGRNIIARWCDCNPAGFYKEAHRQNIMYLAYSDKKDRKLATIDKLNVAWKMGTLFVTENGRKLAEEQVKAEWSETRADSIVGESRLHLSDTARYFIDIKPPFIYGASKMLTQGQEMRQQWKERKVKEYKAKCKLIERGSKWKRRV